MAIRIIHRKDGMYDVYERSTGKWLFSRYSADNVFSWLAEIKYVWIDFVDEQNEGADNG